MAATPTVQTTSRETTPVALAESIEQVAGTFAHAFGDPEAADAGLEQGVGELRRVASALRTMALRFDERRAEALAHREEELRSIAIIVSQTVQDLARSNRQLADHVGSQTRQLEEIADLDPDDDLITDRLRCVVSTLHDATGEIGRDLDHMATGVESSNQRIASLEQELEAARKKSLYDALTKVHSRAALDDRLAAQIADEAAPWCFLLADIDHFKNVNDTLGHLVGDALLYKIAQVLQDCVRDYPGDALVGRYGGEEFAVVLPGATLDQASRVAERMRRQVQDARYQLRARADAIVNPTISIGVSRRRPDDTIDALIDRADTALYQAKDGGRNRVAVEGA